MKRGVNFVLIVSLLFIISLSFVSANTFSDFFNNLFSGDEEVMLSPHHCSVLNNDKDDNNIDIGTNKDCLNPQKNRYYQEGSYCVEESGDKGFCGCEEVNGKILKCLSGWDCVDNACVKNTNDNNGADEINCDKNCVELGNCINGKQTFQCEYIGDCNLDEGGWIEERTCVSNTPSECNPKCSGERICIGGQCKLCSQNSDCPNGQVCLNEGTPQAMCRPMSSFIECNSELKCEKSNQECINGICQNICIEECKQGYFCNDRGKCVKEKSCRAKTMTCEDSTKILTDYKIKCKTSNFKYRTTIMYCPEGQICSDNKCIDKPIELPGESEDVDPVSCTKDAEGSENCQIGSGCKIIGDKEGNLKIGVIYDDGEIGDGNKVLESITSVEPFKTLFTQNKISFEEPLLPIPEEELDGITDRTEVVGKLREYLKKTCNSDKFVILQGYAEDSGQLEKYPDTILTAEEEMVHEFGHLLCGLEDEYNAKMAYGRTQNSNAPNIAKYSKPIFGPNKGKIICEKFESITGSKTCYPLTYRGDFTHKNLASSTEESIMSNPQQSNKKFNLVSCVACWKALEGEGDAIEKCKGFE